MAAIHEDDMIMMMPVEPLILGAEEPGGEGEGELEEASSDEE
jgi:hypothetical protein